MYQTKNDLQTSSCNSCLNRQSAFHPWNDTWEYISNHQKLTYFVRMFCGHDITDNVRVGVKQNDTKNIPTNTVDGQAHWNPTVSGLTKKLYKLQKKFVTTVNKNAVISQKWTLLTSSFPRLSGVMVRVSALSATGRRFNSDTGRVTPKTFLKMTHAASLLDAGH